MVLFALGRFSIGPVQDLRNSHEYGKFEMIEYHKYVYSRVEESYGYRYFRIEKSHGYGYLIIEKLDEDI